MLTPLLTTIRVSTCMYELDNLLKVALHCHQCSSICCLLLKSFELVRYEINLGHFAYILSGVASDSLLIIGVLLELTNKQKYLYHNITQLPLGNGRDRRRPGKTAGRGKTRLRSASFFLGLFSYECKQESTHWSWGSCTTYVMFPGVCIDVRLENSVDGMY